MLKKVYTTGGLSFVVDSATHQALITRWQGERFANVVDIDGHHYMLIMEHIVAFEDVS